MKPGASHAPSGRVVDRGLTLAARLDRRGQHLDDALALDHHRAVVVEPGAVEQGVGGDGVPVMGAAVRVGWAERWRMTQRDQVHPCIALGLRFA